MRTRSLVQFWRNDKRFENLQKNPAELQRLQAAVAYFQYAVPCRAPSHVHSERVRLLAVRVGTLIRTRAASSTRPSSQASTRYGLLSALSSSSSSSSSSASASASACVWSVGRLVLAHTHPRRTW
jgi:hypothetical protein